MFTHTHSIDNLQFCLFIFQDKNLKWYNENNNWYTLVEIVVIEDKKAGKQWFRIKPASFKKIFLQDLIQVIWKMKQRIIYINLNINLNMN